MTADMLAACDERNETHFGDAAVEVVETFEGLFDVDAQHMACLARDRAEGLA